MRFPDDSQREVIVGRTGSGKTQAGVWQLANRSWTTKPWIVYDYKMDRLINSIPGAEHITTQSPLPKTPGIFLVHPHPDDSTGLQRHMWEIWQRENIGVFVDEGYMVCSPTQPNPAFRSLLTQGRSKNIPVIILSQRPAWLDRFVWSESDFFQVFQLNFRGDRRSVNEFMPADLDTRLPDYHSWYYDVGRDETVVLKPVPQADDILSIFQKRVDEMKATETKRVVFI